MGVKQNQLEDYFDVIIVGFGPVGQLCSTLLNKYGLNTAAIESNLDIYSEPRAISIDDEIQRIISNLGLWDDFTRNQEVPDFADLVFPNGKVILRGPVTSTINGFPFVSTFYQPKLESLFRTNLNKSKGTDVLLGYEVINFKRASSNIPNLDLLSQKGINVKDLILSYIKFTSPVFKQALQRFESLELDAMSLKGQFRYNLEYKGVHTTFALGGIHGARKSGVYKSDEDHIIMSSDVTSFYPNLCIRNKWSPAHFPKEEFCDQYEWFFNERVKIPKSNPMNYVYKIILNSTFGLSNEENSFFYDPELCMRITLNGQLSLMMLYEMICERIPEAFGLLQNTDGVEIRIPRDKKELYLEICKEWEEMTQLNLEHDTYQKLILGDVNNYMKQMNLEPDVFTEKLGKIADDITNELGNLSDLKGSMVESLDLKLPKKTKQKWDSSLKEFADGGGEIDKIGTDLDQTRNFLKKLEKKEGHFQYTENHWSKINKANGINKTGFDRPNMVKVLHEHNGIHIAFKKTGEGEGKFYMWGRDWQPKLLDDVLKEPGNNMFKQWANTSAFIKRPVSYTHLTLPTKRIV